MDSVIALGIGCGIGYVFVKYSNEIYGIPRVIHSTGDSEYTRYVKKRYPEIKNDNPDLDKNELCKIIAIEWRMMKEGFTR
jgi:hypothetical protein